MIRKRLVLFFSIYLFALRFTLTLFEIKFDVAMPSEVLVLLSSTLVMVVLSLKFMPKKIVLFSILFIIFSLISVGFSYDYIPGEEYKILSISTISYIFLYPLLFFLGNLWITLDLRSLKIVLICSSLLWIINLILIYFFASNSLYEFLQEVSYIYLSEGLLLTILLCSIFLKQKKKYLELPLLSGFLLIPSRAAFLLALSSLSIRNKFILVLILLSGYLYVSDTLEYLNFDSISMRLINFGSNDDSLSERSILFNSNLNDLRDSPMFGKFLGDYLVYRKSGGYFHNILWIYHYYGIFSFLIYLYALLSIFFRKVFFIKYYWKLLFFVLGFSLIRGPGTYSLIFVMGLLYGSKYYLSSNYKAYNV